MIKIKINKYFNGVDVDTAMLTKGGGRIRYVVLPEGGRITVRAWSTKHSDLRERPRLVGCQAVRDIHAYQDVDYVRRGWEGTLILNEATIGAQWCSDKVASFLEYTGADNSYCQMLSGYYTSRTERLTGKTFRLTDMVIIRGGVVEWLDCSTELVVPPTDATLIIYCERCGEHEAIKVAINGYSNIKAAERMAGVVKEIINKIKG
jgi:hypothetical protein